MRKFALDQARNGECGSRIARLLFEQFKVRKSRSAVIGCVFRAGVRLRGGNKKKYAAPVARRQRAKKARAPKKLSPLQAYLAHASPEPLPVEDNIVIPPAERKSLLELDPNDCRWPFGDPRDREFHFCGRPKVPSMAYCIDHARRAYQVPQVATSADKTTPQRVGERENVA